MHPPQHAVRNAVRAASVVLAALFTILAAATPASAAPTSFSASDRGEDGCTVFETAGQADWSVNSIPEMPPVELTGKTYTYADGHMCLPVVPRDRHVEFIGYDRYGKPIAELAVPVSVDGGSEYTEYLVGPYGTRIAYVTVAVCVTQPATGSGAVRDCGATQVVYPQPARG
ncbi:hypothetical protein [Glycomyces algeriensis]|uniref:Secreted protein n=1 Tax=Glycomyces algeriensis TaxID=256037 RepID=A0A9W6LHC4_9ACTN|nr:hypothetical protein [Glycomyces algeriensis]MDA1365005.1 hypothetical protein [Glycomyces algeriensis]MDR7349934.1 hypothetical protein [Glycomyces algeriensis]GLI42644.1 hypothetical protein GALLR39Z86_24940 [Glycomyces algeriensis]